MVFVLLVNKVIYKWPYYVYFNKNIGIAFFHHSHFLGFTQSFRIFGHAFVCNRQKDKIFKVFEFSVAIFVLLFVKLIFGVHQIYTQQGKFGP